MIRKIKNNFYTSNINSKPSITRKRNVYDNIHTQVAKAKCVEDFGKQQMDIEADYEKIEESDGRAPCNHYSGHEFDPPGTRWGTRLEHPHLLLYPRWKLESSFQPEKSF